jgi:pimeloyl-ACP methyl ester carboxylesterase
MNAMNSRFGSGLTIFKSVALVSPIVLFVCSGLHAQTISAAERTASRLPLTVCKADWGEEELLCGTLEVYENRVLKAGRKIALKVIVIPSLAENPEPDPIFYFEGGPGVAATDAAYSYAIELPYRETRDIVLVDLRGMGGSNPLHCDMVGDPLKMQNFLNEMYPVELVRACREQLEQIADLTQYTTTIAMEDIEDVRAWLGYERINIIGLSYGGRAAYVYARAHPERVRSIVLIGPADIESKLPLYHAQQAEKAYSYLCSDCRADSACNSAFPSLERELHELVEDLRINPATVSYPHPMTKETTSVTIRAEIFFEKVRRALYAAGPASYVPWIVHSAYQKNFSPFLDLVLPSEFGQTPFLADGAYLSITGAEDAPFFTETEAQELSAGTFLGNYRVFQQRRAATLWPKGNIPANYLDNVVLDMPTLIIQGRKDPVIGSGSTIKRYRNGRELLIPQMNHVPWGLSNIECLDNLMNTFFVTADWRALDTTCIQNMLPPPFKVSDEDID